MRKVPSEVWNEWTHDILKHLNGSAVYLAIPLTPIHVLRGPWTR